MAILNYPKFSFLDIVDVPRKLQEKIFGEPTRMDPALERRLQEGEYWDKIKDVTGSLAEADKPVALRAPGEALRALGNVGKQFGQEVYGATKALSSFGDVGKQFGQEVYGAAKEFPMSIAREAQTLGDVAATQSKNYKEAMASGAITPENLGEILPSTKKSLFQLIAEPAAAVGTTYFAKGIANALTQAIAPDSALAKNVVDLIKSKMPADVKLKPLGGDESLKPLSYDNLKKLLETPKPTTKLSQSIVRDIQKQITFEKISHPSEAGMAQVSRINYQDPSVKALSKVNVKGIDSWGELFNKLKGVVGNDSVAQQAVVNHVKSRWNLALTQPDLTKEVLSNLSKGAKDVSKNVNIIHPKSSGYGFLGFNQPRESMIISGEGYGAQAGAGPSDVLRDVVKNVATNLQKVDPGAAKAVASIDVNKVKGIDQLSQLMKNAVSSMPKSPAVDKIITDWSSLGKNIMKASAGLVSGASAGSLTAHLDYERDMTSLLSQLNNRQRNNLRSVDKDLLGRLLDKAESTPLNKQGTNTYWDKIKGMADDIDKTKIGAQLKNVIKEGGQEIKNVIKEGGQAIKDVLTKVSSVDAATIYNYLIPKSKYLEYYDESEIEREGKDIYLKPGMDVRWDTKIDPKFTPNVISTEGESYRGPDHNFGITCDRGDAYFWDHMTVNVPETGLYKVEAHVGYSGESQPQEEYRLQLNDGWMGEVVNDLYNGPDFPTGEDHWFWVNHGVFYLPEGDNTFTVRAGNQPTCDDYSCNANSIHADNFRIIKTKDKVDEPIPTIKMPAPTKEQNICGRIPIKWSNSTSKDVKKYMVERRLSGTSKWKWFLVTDVNSYNDESIIPNVKYDYRITGLDKDEEPVTEPSSPLPDTWSYCYRGNKWYET